MPKHESEALRTIDAFCRGLLRTIEENDLSKGQIISALEDSISYEDETPEG